MTSQIFFETEQVYPAFMDRFDDLTETCSFEPEETGPEEETDPEEEPETDVDLGFVDDLSDEETADHYEPEDDSSYDDSDD